MTYASLKVTLLVLATGGLIAACASGTDTTEFSSGASAGGGPAMSTTSGDPDTGVTTGAGGNGGAAGVTAGVTTATTGGGDCVPKCSADLDCQNSCPATQTGINCCDAPSGFCYVASTNTCPTPNPASTSTGAGPY